MNKYELLTGDAEAFPTSTGLRDELQDRFSELADIERLRDVSVRAQSQPPLPVLRLAFGRDDNDRRKFLESLANRSYDPGTIQLRHVHVCENEVDILPHQFLDCSDAVLRLHDLHARQHLDQVEQDEHPHCLGVIGNKYFFVRKSFHSVRAPPGAILLSGSHLRKVYPNGVSASRRAARFYDNIQASFRGAGKELS